jgi:predicted helicase
MEKTNIYTRSIQGILSTGIATEGSYYGALQSFVQAFSSEITATYLISRIKCGAPDFAITKGLETIGYIEAKNIGKNLEDIELGRGDDGLRFKRYLNSLPNIILTNYLEFRWYTNGNRRSKAALGTLVEGNRIIVNNTGTKDTCAILSAFLSNPISPINNSRELAQRMAVIARRIYELVFNSFEKEIAPPSILDLYNSFRDALIPDMSKKEFSDMYAQTMTYGLFAARCNILDDTAFTRQAARDFVPKTNPFLRNVFDHIAGAQLPDLVKCEAEDLVQILSTTEIEKILGAKVGIVDESDDPLFHFYETFLAEYNPAIQKQRGVYYTPQPIVSFIVRSIDILLSDCLSKSDGFASENVIVLDPCVGTGTFFHRIVKQIYANFVAKGRQGDWPEFVSEKLLQRIFGFEILMAPFTIAHLKMLLLLKNTSCILKGDERFGIYLTNTLEIDLRKPSFPLSRWIIDESAPAKQIKENSEVLVVLGNPPYSVRSSNKGPHIEQLMESYKKSVKDEKNIAPLSNDYVKFLRWAHDRIDRTGQGIVGMVTNNSYLWGPIHRGMREELMKSFSDIYILNLHGSTLMKETSATEESIFAMRDGVSIILLAKRRNQDITSKIHYYDKYGMRAEKLQFLETNDVNTIQWDIFAPEPPSFFFKPRNIRFDEEYQKGIPISKIFSVWKNGVQTGADKFIVQFDVGELKNRVNDFFDRSLSDDEIGKKYQLTDKSGWSLSRERVKAIREGIRPELFIKYLYRPFDLRWIYFSKRTLKRPVLEIMSNMLRPNLALITCRQQIREGFSHVFVTNHVGDGSAISLETREWNSYFPLYIYQETAKSAELPDREHCSRLPNFNQEFIDSTEQRLGLKFIMNSRLKTPENFCPEDVFNYIYALLHSSGYRTRYGYVLQNDFPRIPFTSHKKLFHALATIGNRLVTLHLIDQTMSADSDIEYPITGHHIVEKLSYNTQNRRIYINKDQYFQGISPEVWEYRIGGFFVCQKWLKDRKNRTLKLDDRILLRSIASRLASTISLIQEIEDLIPGWPLE